MRVWGFDPGSVATGLALYDTNGPVIHWRANQYIKPTDAYIAFTANADWEDIVLVEDYRSGGHLTNDAKRTIKIVGYLEHSLTRHGYHLRMRWEQQRISGNREADKLMRSSGIENPEDKAHKDARAALAHAIAFTREYGS